MKYIIREHYRIGDVWDRMKTETYEEAEKILLGWTNVLPPKDGKYWGKPVRCCPVTNYYTIDKLED